MQLAYALSAITFVVCISLYVTEVEPGLDHPMHMFKLICAKYLDMPSSNLHSMPAPTADSSY